jgi:hypothetical protein
MGSFSKDPDGDLLHLFIIGKVFVLDPGALHQFFECFEFAFFPSRVVEIFVETDDRPRNDLFVQVLKNGNGGRIQITIDMQEGNRFRICGYEWRERFIEPSLVQDDIGIDAWQGLVPVEKAFIEPIPPEFGQPLEGVEPMNFVGNF